MRSSWVLGLVLYAITQPCATLVLIERDAPAVISLSTGRSPRDGTTQTKLNARANTVDAVLDNEVYFYYVNVSVGKPQQSLRLSLAINTGDIWVDAPSSQICGRSTENCGGSGSYNANISATSKYINSKLDLTYADDTKVSGDFVQDNLEIGGVTVSAMNLGVGYNASSTGILGIGYSTLQGDYKYPSLVFAMANQGLIASPTFSMWLNDIAASTGELLFGGINTAKFRGTLATMDMVSDSSGEFGYIRLNVSSMDVTMSNGATNVLDRSGGTSFTAALDPGSSFCQLPSSYTTELYQLFNVTYNATDSSTPSIDCSQTGSAAQINFHFQSITIGVPLSEMIISYGDGTCLFGILPVTGTSPTYILGATMLRSAYVVVDLANNQVSIAQTHYNSAENNIVEIGAGPNPIPSVTGLVNVQTTRPTNTPTATAGINDQPPLITSQAPTPHHGLSTGAKAGIGIGAVVGAALLGLGAFCLFVRLRKRRNAKVTQPIRHEKAAPQSPSTSQAAWNHSAFAVELPVHQEKVDPTHNHGAGSDPVYHGQELSHHLDESLQELSHPLDGSIQGAIRPESSVSTTYPQSSPVNVDTASSGVQGSTSIGFDEGIIMIESQLQEVRAEHNRLSRIQELKEREEELQRQLAHRQSALGSP